MDYYLKQLNLLGFKNHIEADFSFSKGVNCIVGNNGVGKTNVLDAIYYLSFCKSYFNPSDTQNINRENEFFLISGEFEFDEKQELISCSLKKGQKKVFKRNKKEYDRLSDHIGLLPLVFITPSDTDIIHGGSELRRKFIDGIIAQSDKNYLENLLMYGKALQQRNILLKQWFSGDHKVKEIIDLYDIQLQNYGEPIFEARKLFLNKYIPVFQKHYKALVNEVESVSILYSSQLLETDFENGLRSHLPKDKVLQYTSFGIHKDDLLFSLEGEPLKRFASQGQQKSFVVALKLAQFEYMKELKQRKPFLLLDDIFDKLDKKRVQSLMQMVSRNDFGQIFVTDANKQRIEELFSLIDVEPKVFLIERDKSEKQITV